MTVMNCLCFGYLIITAAKTESYSLSLKIMQSLLYCMHKCKQATLNYFLDKVKYTT
jgi:hypothetical protein